jgi:hypothetical protein
MNSFLVNGSRTNAPRFTFFWLPLSLANKESATMAITLFFMDDYLGFESSSSDGRSIVNIQNNFNSWAVSRPAFASMFSR